MSHMIPLDLNPQVQQDWPHVTDAKPVLNTTLHPVQEYPIIATT